MILVILQLPKYRGPFGSPSSQDAAPHVWICLGGWEISELCVAWFSSSELHESSGHQQCDQNRGINHFSVTNVKEAALMDDIRFLC